MWDWLDESVDRLLTVSRRVFFLALAMIIAMVGISGVYISFLLLVWVIAQVRTIVTG